MLVGSWHCGSSSLITSNPGDSGPGDTPALAQGSVRVVSRWRVIVGLHVGKGWARCVGLRCGFFLLVALGSEAVCLDGLGLPRRPDPRLSYVRGGASRALLRRVAAR